ncbi:etf1 [Phaffia rhodozyma]|uniref:Probable electron transfer flavoprotein subunit alpha n=1 Tax=Phaffia rhodozyma TaxID=264483 RepID=A0A0F7SQY0_PHARH|nr:etf1 [Phaffia rhodozyma]
MLALRSSARSATTLASLISRSSSLLQARSLSSLVFVEHKRGEIVPSSLSAITAAKAIGDDVSALVTGKEGDVQAIVDKVKSIPGLSKVFSSTSPDYEHYLSEPLAPLLASVVPTKGFSHLVGAHSAVGKDLFPRVSALLDTTMISDVVKIEAGGEQFTRPIYAGNIIAQIKSTEAVKILTIRPTAFEKAALEGGAAEAETVEAVPASSPVKFVSTSETVSARPDLGSASKVVSGGRALKNKEQFGGLMEPLADALGAAIGASRAAVDAGYADNNLQVGQTGKVVAPELYVAVGISGAIQHLAGMKESKLIVAINKDKEAPIFQVADVGLVGDLYDHVPELTKAIQGIKSSS